jgi:hypothetical protein
MDPKETPATKPAAAAAANNVDSAESAPFNGPNPAMLDELLKRVTGRSETAAAEPPKEEPKAAPEPPAEPEAESDPDLSQSNDELPADQAGEEQAEEQEAKPDEQAEQEPEAEEDKGPDWYQKRLAKITRARREAEEKAAALESKVRELEGKATEKSEDPPVVAAVPNDPLAEVWSERKLDEEYTKARELKRWCDQHAEGAVVGGREYTADEVRQIRYNVEDALELHIPRRAAFLAQHKQLRPIAEKVYPWWKDRTSADYQAAQDVLRNAPHLMQHADYQVLVGDFLEGRKARLAREAAAKAPAKPKPAVAATKPVPKQPSKPAAAPSKVDEAAKVAAQRKRQFATTGSVSDLASLLR